MRDWKAWLVLFAVVAGAGLSMRKVHAQTLKASPASPLPAPQAQSWTVTVMDKWSDSNGNQVVSLHFDDSSGQTYDVNDFIPFGASSTQLQDFAADIIAKLSAQKVVMNAAPTTGLAVTPTVANTPPTDVNASIKATFLADYLLLKQCLAAQKNGIVTTGIGDLCLGQLAKVQGEWTANESIVLPLVDVGP